MRPDNGTLSSRPDLFEFAPNPLKTGTFAAIAGVLVALAIVSVVGFESVQEFAVENSNTRRSRALAPYLGYVLPAGLGGFGLWAGLHAGRTGTWRMASGDALRKRSWPLDADLDDLHARLSTGDPQVYLPLPKTRRSRNPPQLLRSYTIEDSPVTFVTLSLGTGRAEKHWPLIVLEGEQSDAFLAGVGAKERT